MPDNAPSVGHWERIAVLEWDRHGMPQTVRALTGGMALREGETEYVRADEFERLREALRRIAEYNIRDARDLGARRVAREALDA